MLSVSDTLSRIGFGYAILGRDERRSRAYTNAARIVGKFGAGLPEAYADGSLAAVRGVGKSILKVVGAVLADEPVPQLVELEAEIPDGVFEMRKLRGIGPSKVQVLWLTLGLTSIAELEYACNENRLVELPGFGPTTQRKVGDAIAALKSQSRQARMNRAQAIAAHLVALLQADPRVQRAEIVGQVRRGCELTDRVEIATLGEAEIELPPDIHGLPIAVHVCTDPTQWGAHLVRTTGAPEHVAALEARGALQGATEDEVYRNLTLFPTAPERREDGVPLLELGRPVPELVRSEEIRGALHNHTTASDGIHSLEEMRAAATRLGFEYLGISDHSQSAGYAGGLLPLRLLAQIDEIAELNALSDGGCWLLSGVESDILRDGALDYPSQVLAELDVVIASVHMRHRQDARAMTERMLRAARDPWTDIIGHPTGRLLLGRPPSEFDVEAMLDACADAGSAVELNANPQRLDLNARHCAMAQERGVLVSIAADAHSGGALTHVEYGVTLARRAGLRAEDVLNCKPLDELEAWLHARKTRALAAGAA
jgi:DNA polymerase (family 10)